MPALVAGIHVLNVAPNEDVDGRNKPGHDELWRVIDVRLRGCAIPARSRGRGEMVDARDLKSLGSNFPCRFKSGRPHQHLGVLRCPLDLLHSIPKSSRYRG
jgi:hypothetical protein